MKQKELLLSKLHLILLLMFSATMLYSQTDEAVSTLFSNTLYSDINTASYYELLNWCRELALDTTGNTDFLRNQLFSHYGVDLQSVAEDESGGKTIVKIVSADSSEYYNIEEIDEDYVRISGRVKLIVKQPSKNITHTIEADTVLFNQTTDTMTASGNIHYTKLENGKEEIYSGDNFTFNVQSWKGVILKGDFRKSQEVGDEEMEFIFSGEAIKKGEGDVVVLDEGSITSCDSEDTHYQIKARKIWILGPDEWAILSGFLYVGHVPLLYIPFYHLPGNDLFFNPVIGNETRRGYFIQTTTYLLGRKESSEEDDSFFINVADTDESYKLERQGLYLFKEKGDPEEKGSDYIKYMLDYYSILGAYAAFQGSMANWGQLKNITFDLGMGVTLDPYVNNLPFRWRGAFGFTLFNFTTAIEYMTDNYFISDYGNRSENFDWLNYLLSQTTEEEAIDETSQNSLNWSIQGNLNIPNEWASNYITTMSLNPLKLHMYWNKFNEGYSSFYPETITWPQTTLNLSGVLLDYSDKNEQSLPEDQVESRESLRSPWNGKDQSVENGVSNPERTLTGPLRLEDIIVSEESDLISAKLNYSLSSYLNFISYTDSSDWASTSDIDFEILKSLLTSNNSFSLNYNMSFLEQMISIGGKNSFTVNHLSYHGENEDISDDELARGLDGRKLNWNNTLDFSLKPLINISYLNNSSISYDFDTTLYKRTYDQAIADFNNNIITYEQALEDFEDEWIAWDDDYITAHKAAVNFDFRLPMLTTIISFDTTLPPLDIKQSINPSLEFTLWKWTSKVSGKILYEDEWKLDPLRITTSFNPIEKIGLSGNFTYDFELEEPTALMTSLKLWAFSGTYNMAYTNDYEWDRDTQQLIDKGKRFVPLSVAFAFDYDYESPLLWENRINMSGGINTTFTMNLQQNNLTSLGVKLFYNLHIFEFLDLKFSVNSSNNYMFLYFAGLREDYGITEEYNFFRDLVKSFNFFSTDQQDRYDSFFNMNSLDISLVHKLHDWDLELTYKGKPVVDEGETNSRWDSTFSILVRWNPIEKLKVKTDYGDQLWNVDTEFE